MKNYIDELPEKIRNGSLTEQQAVNATAVWIHKNPGLYGLSRFDEDFRSDVITSFLITGYIAFRKYRAECGTFSGYLFSFVTGIILTSKRNRLNSYFSETSFYQLEKNTYEDTQDMYAVFEPSVPYTVFRRTGKRIFTITDFCRNRSTSQKAKIALVLALKASYFISDEHIKRLCDMCRLDKERILSTVEKLKFTLIPRVEVHTKLIQSRDNAFFFHRKYYLQLRFCDRNKIDYKKLYRKYQKHTAAWKIKNSILQNSGYHICPTNSTIAHLLGISERQISYYISKAKSMYNSEKTGNE